MSDFRPWKVLDLRLNEPLPSLAGKADVEGYWVASSGGTTRRSAISRSPPSSFR